jgi:TetR/AcrR family transcriptional regulator
MAHEQSDTDTRSTILRVAEAQFGAKGYSGTHLQSIASEVGVQKTALYYYFDSKEALYVAVLERMLESFDAVMGRKDRGAPSVASLQSALDDLNQVLAANPNYSQILVRIFVDRIQVDASLIEPIIIQMIDPMVRFFAAGVERGIFRRLSSRQALLSVLGAAAFYYAAGQSSADIVGVESIFEDTALEWRRAEFNRFVMNALVAGRGDVEPRS